MSSTEAFLLAREKVKLGVDAQSVRSRRKPAIVLHTQALRDVVAPADNPARDARHLERARSLRPGGLDGERGGGGGSTSSSQVSAKAVDALAPGLAQWLFAAKEGAEGAGARTRYARVV
jgi:hypothetical protein